MDLLIHRLQSRRRHRCDRRIHGQAVVVAIGDHHVQGIADNVDRAGRMLHRDHRRAAVFDQRIVGLHEHGIGMRARHGLVHLRPQGRDFFRRDLLAPAADRTAGTSAFARRSSVKSVSRLMSYGSFGLRMRLWRKARSHVLPDFG